MRADRSYRDSIHAGADQASVVFRNHPELGGKLPGSGREPGANPPAAGAMESVLSGDLDRTVSRYLSRLPYSGAFSLQDYPERDVSLTTTLFLGLRLEQNTYLYFNPEIAGGRGFSGVNGLANSSNGELPRVASATPKPYLARLYVSHDFGFGDETESF